MTSNRHTARVDGDVILYINGFHLNRIRSLPAFLYIAYKVTRMLRRADADPDVGLLSFHQGLIGLRSGIAVQYWDSVAELKRYAYDPTGEHPSAWTWLAENVGDGIGFFSELYRVPADEYAASFTDAPEMGLFEAGDRVEMPDERPFDLSADRGPPGR